MTVLIQEIIVDGCDMLVVLLSKIFCAMIQSDWFPIWCKYVYHKTRTQTFNILSWLSGLWLSDHWQNAVPGHSDGV